MAGLRGGNKNTRQQVSPFPDPTAFIPPQLHAGRSFERLGDGIFHAMIPKSQQVLAMLAGGYSKPAITAHLRQLYPRMSPTYLTGFVERVAAYAKKKDLLPSYPKPATTG